MYLYIIKTKHNGNKSRKLRSNSNADHFRSNVRYLYYCEPLKDRTMTAKEHKESQQRAGELQKLRTYILININEEPAYILEQKEMTEVMALKLNNVLRSKGEETRWMPDTRDEE